MIRHATLSDKEIHWISPDRKLRRIILGKQNESLDDLWTVAQTYNIHTLWIMPRSFWDYPAVNLETEGFDSFVVYDDQEKKLSPRFARIRKQGVSGHSVNIGWAHRGRFQWEIDHPLDVLASVLYLREELGIELAWSPGHAGDNLLKEIHTLGRRPKWIREPTIDMSTIPFGQSARDLLFVRPLDMDDIGKYDVCYDKSSSYLGGMIDLLLGSGNPVHVDYRGKYEPTKHDMREAGIYRVRFESGMSRFNGDTLPYIFSKEWVTTKLLNLAIEEGYHIWLYEGWIFEESHKILKPFAEKLWNARSAFREESEKYPYDQARLNAFRTAKQMAIISTGRLGEKRKDWLFQVVGSARVIMLYNLMATYNKCGKLPFLIYNDEMHFVSSDQDPRFAVEDMMKREGQLGGYKHKYSVRITEEMVLLSQECCKSNPRKVGRMQKYIGAIANE